ncbi:MAG: hypothetical protein ACXW0F_13765 [Gaiellaceae bacterium]
MLRAAAVLVSSRPDPNLVHDKGAKSTNRQRESPGVDYLLPYWIAVYLGVMPKPPPP